MDASVLEPEIVGATTPSRFSPLRLVRKEEVMPIPNRTRQELREQVEPTEQAGLNGEISRSHEEVLVPDPRHGLTPAMMVELKLQVMLESYYRGILDQRNGRPGSRGRTSDR
jgi:hypothetical protein